MPGFCVDTDAGVKKRHADQDGRHERTTEGPPKPIQHYPPHNPPRFPHLSTCHRKALQPVRPLPEQLSLLFQILRPDVLCKPKPDCAEVRLCPPCNVDLHPLLRHILKGPSGGGRGIGVLSAVPIRWTWQSSRLHLLQCHGRAPVGWHPSMVFYTMALWICVELQRSGTKMFHKKPRS